MTPEQFVLIRKDQRDNIDRAHEGIKAAKDLAEKCPFPKNTRPATQEDIKVDAVIWYKESDIGPIWRVIDEVYKPDDQWKAYCDHDGCRMGLRGAFVEIHNV